MFSGADSASLNRDGSWQGVLGNHQGTGPQLFHPGNPNLGFPPSVQCHLEAMKQQLSDRCRVDRTPALGTGIGQLLT